MKKWIMGITTIALILNMVFSPSGYIIFEPNLALAEGEDLEPPSLVIGKDAELPVITAGDETTLVVPVRNRGGGDATNVMASIVVSDPATFPFVIDKMTPRISGPVIMGNSWGYIHFQHIQVAPTAESKIYPLEIKIEYKTPLGAETNVSGTIFVQIVNDKGTPDIKLVNLDLGGQERLASDSTVTIQLQFKNDSNGDAKDVKVKLSGFSSEGINLEQITDTWSSPLVKQREFFYTPFTISLGKDMTTAAYSLDAHITYKDTANKEYTRDEKIYLPVTGEGVSDDSKLEPRVIITHYSYGGNGIHAGNTFPLSLTFYNTHTTKDVSNLKVSLSSDENIFIPIGATNTFYIPDIPAQGTFMHEILLQPKIDASTKTYSLTAAIDYADAKGNKFSESQTVGIPVVQEINLTVAEVQAPAQCIIYERVGLSVDYYNMGRALIRNLMITTSGNFEISNGDMYVGNLESGKSDYFDVMITPNEAGTAHGEILFSYEDVMGNKYERSRTFTIEVQEMPAMPEVDLTEPGKETPVTDQKPWLIGGAAALAAVGVIIWIVRRRRQKAKEALEFDE